MTVCPVLSKPDMLIAQQPHHDNPKAVYTLQTSLYRKVSRNKHIGAEPRVGR
jgi:hypothetical protein